jgi:class 3 adenylate cyclase
VEDGARSSVAGSPHPGATDYERRIVSILFADLVGFTTLAERLDAEDVAAVQDRYFALVRETVGRYGGVIEKFIGDAAMAAFGVPRARDDDAERAVRAGLAIVNGVDGLAIPLGLESGALAVRVGIATGEVVHAASGTDAGRLSGDTVNTAARLQTAAPSGRVLLGETTALAVAEAIELEPHDEIALKGKAEPTRVALAVGARAVRSREAAMGDLHASTIGREGELDTLEAALARVRTTGTNEMWLVVAPPGVGKSRLLGDLSRRIEAASGDASVIVATARFRSGDGRPFEALSDLAAELVDGPSADDLEADLRRGGLPAGRARVVAGRLADLARAGETTSSGEAADRDALFDAWLAGFDALAAGHAQAWLLEDLHWAGPDVLAFLRRAQEMTAPGGRFVVATARPSILEAGPAIAMGEPGRHVLDLPALPPSTTGDLVRALVGDALAAGLVARIATSSDGNPLFVEELLRSWVSVGLLVRAEDTWRLTAAAPDLPVAPTVQAIYAAQLDDLPPVARQVTRQGSVAGRRAPRDFLLDLELQGPDEAISSLVRRALLAGPSPDPPLGDAYSYRHALLRDAGYASLARAERATLHVAFARWVERLLGDSDVGAEWIGEHLESAVREAPALATEVALGLDRAAAAVEAAAWLERAGEAAVRRAARDRAIDLFRRSLALTGEGADLEAARRERRLGETIGVAGRFDEAATTLESSLDRYRLARAAAMDPGRAAEAREGMALAADSLGRILQEQVRFEASWTLADSVLEEIDPTDDLPSARLRFRAAIGRNMFSDDSEDLLPAAREAVEVARRAGDEQLELDALLDVVLMSSSSTSDAGILDEVDALAARRGRFDVLARTTRIRGLLIAQTSDDPFPFFDRSAEIAESHGLYESLGWAENYRAELGFGRGRWDVALEAGARAIELGETHGYDRIVVRTWHSVGMIAAARGDLDLLRRCRAWYVAAEAFLPHSPYGLMMRAGMHELFARCGLEAPEPRDPAELMPSFELANVEMPTWFEAIDLVFRRLLGDGRADAVEDALGPLTSSAEADPTPLSRAAVALFRARLALETRDAGSAAEYARAGIRELEPAQGPWLTARAIRLLEDAGAATDADLASAIAIERNLRIAAPSD